MTRLAIVHDYLTQRGGAERVVLAMAEAFPGAPIYTSLYHPEGTFPEFADLDVRPSALNAVALFRRRHRAALPFLASAFSNMDIDAGIVLCSSSGWAHGVPARGARKLVYCYSPARWLYLPQQYLTTGTKKLAMGAMRKRLVRWDQRAAASADHYLAISSAVQRRVADIYGIDAPILHPPHAADGDADQVALPGIEPGFFLVVSRLLPYKNVDVVVKAMAELPSQRLVVVGEGPERARLEGEAGGNVHFAGTVTDAELRWLYAEAAAVVSGAHEDLGLTPLEGAAFGTPSVTLGAGGFLDTVVPGQTGLFFGELSPHAVATVMKESLNEEWSAERLRRHAAGFSRDVFVERLRAAIARLRPPR